MINAVIIDDENKSRQLLHAMLAELCPQVEVKALCENLHAGITAIKKYRPQLVFLDIEMPGYSGLQLPEFLDAEEMTFDIVFVTAYNEFAIRAFKLEAMDYLLKPVDADLLVEAVHKCEKRQRRDYERYTQLKQRFEPEPKEHLAIYQVDGIRLVDYHNILFLQGEGAYTKIVCANGLELLASKNLKHFEQHLAHASRFFRCHKSFIINLHQVLKVQKGERPVAIIQEHEVAISVQKVEELLTKLGIG